MRFSNYDQALAYLKRDGAKSLEDRQNAFAVVRTKMNPDSAAYSQLLVFNGMKRLDAAQAPAAPVATATPTEQDHFVKQARSESEIHLYAFAYATQGGRVSLDILTPSGEVLHLPKGAAVDYDTRLRLDISAAKFANEDFSKDASYEPFDSEMMEQYPECIAGENQIRTMANADAVASGRRPRYAVYKPVLAGPGVS